MEKEKIFGKIVDKTVTFVVVAAASALGGLICRAADKCHDDYVARKRAARLKKNREERKRKGQKK